MCPYLYPQRNGLFYSFSCKWTHFHVSIFGSGCVLDFYLFLQCISMLLICPERHVFRCAQTEKVSMDEAPLIICTKCNNVMDRKSIRGVEIDVCGGCGGIWLDRGELIKLKLKAGKRTIENIQDSKAEVVKVPPTSGRVRLPCPVCEGKLLPLQVEQVAVEICNSCGGLFLDHGELDPVLTALGGGVDMATLDALIGIDRSS